MNTKQLHILLLIWLCCWAAWAGAQTPYDSFAPELSRPILDKDSVDAWRKEQQMLREKEQLLRQREILTRLQQEPVFVAFDLQQQMCYLLDTAMQVLAYTPIPEDVQRWLSVDPLVDKNISTSPYLYCNGNPVMFIDPDGRYAVENIDGNTSYKTILVLPTEQGMSRMKTDSKAVFQTTHQMATSQGIPTLLVDNAKNYVAAMEHLESIGASTESYVLATSHGYRTSSSYAIMVGTDIFTNTHGDFSQFYSGLSNRTVFITACELTSSKTGIELIERFASNTGSIIIGADYSIPGYLGGFQGKDLNLSPIVNKMFGIFGLNYHNSFKATDGTTTETIYNLTIDANNGIQWNNGNKCVFTR